MSIMSKHQARKLFLFGRYSLAILPPKKWLTELGLKRGDSISLELDKKRGRIIIRLNDGQIDNIPPAPTKKKQLPERAEDSGWEPIPSL